MYTASGDLELIAMNPCKVIPGMYSDEIMEGYIGSKLDSVDPHVFAVAERVFASITDSVAETPVRRPTFFLRTSHVPRRRRLPERRRRRST